MSIVDKLKSQIKEASVQPRPVWKGPEVDGITFSLLSRFLACRERFRLLVVEGLKPLDTFNHRIEYGNMWHVCEEAYAGRDKVASKGDAGKVLADSLWKARLQDYASLLCRRYPLQQEQVDHWYNVCKVQFPVYVDYWSKHPNVVNRTPLLQEQVFNVPYSLPSGRTVRLRGKWDSVDLVTEGKESKICLQENKTKGDIREVQLKRQLSYDLQTMLYLIALIEFQKSPKQYRLGDSGIPRGASIAGIRYNVVRRPLSGGKGSIVRHKATKNQRGESKEEFYWRLQGIIREDPGYYFMRWKATILLGDIEKFRRECLDPVLEQLCDWWEWIQDGIMGKHGLWGNTKEEDRNPIHWRYPFGVYNPLNEGNASDLDEYLATGSLSGLTRTQELFEELKGE